MKNINLNIVKLLALSTVFLLSNTKALGAKRVLTFGTLDYCPLICKESSIGPGVMVEITNRIFSKKNITIVYKFMSLKRADAEIRSKTIDGFVGGSIENFSQNHFPMTPVLSQPVSFFTPVNSKWKYQSIHSLDNITIAAIRDFKYKDKKVNEFLEKSKNTLWLGKELGHKRAFELLNLGRIDVFIGGGYTTQHLLNKMNYQNRIKLSNSIEFYDNFVSMTNKLTKDERDELLDFFDKEMTNLQKSGKLSEIYRKYGLSILKNK